VNPLAWTEQRAAGACDRGSFPHELPGYRHISGDAVRETVEAMWKSSSTRNRLRHTQHVDAAIEGTFMGSCAGRRPSCSRSQPQHVVAAMSGWNALASTISFLTRPTNYRPRVHAGIDFLRGRHFPTRTGASSGRKVMTPRNGLADWEVTIQPCQKPRAMTCPKSDPRALDEIAALTPTFRAFILCPARRSSARCNGLQREDAAGTPVMHIDGFGGQRQIRR